MAASEGRPALLVTGGAGYVGSHVCKAAAAAGYLPVTFDNLSSGHRWAVRWGPLEQGDLREANRLRAALDRWRPQAVVHLAGLIDTRESVSDPAPYYDNNVGATLTLLACMRHAGIERIVFSSTAAVYGEPAYAPIDEGHTLRPLSPYGASKLAVERILEDFGHAYGLRTASLRYFNAAGADEGLGVEVAPAGADEGGEIGEAHPVETHLIPLVLEAAAGRCPAVSIHGDNYDTPDGTCVRDFVHVDDLATAHVLAVRHLERKAGVRVFNLGSGQGATVRQVIEAVAEITKGDIPVSVGPRRPGDPAVLLADIALAGKELGWRPALSDLDRIIASAWDWHRKSWKSSAA